MEAPDTTVPLLHNHGSADESNEPALLADINGSHKSLIEQYSLGKMMFSRISAFNCLFSMPCTESGYITLIYHAII